MVGSDTMDSSIVTLIPVLALLAVLLWFDRRCLVDLANTRDEDLRHLSRNGWALVIVMSFPIGPVLYLLYAKGPRRYV